MTDTLKIATVNCQDLATGSKRQDVLFFKEHVYSIICLQDTHCSKDIELFVKNQWDIYDVLILSGVAKIIILNSSSIKLILIMMVIF